MSSIDNTVSDNGTMSSNLVLACRLSDFGLIPFEVGGGGNCLFRAISHQIYGNANRHLEIRRTGVQYMSHNPEQFIESNTENSWMAYLNNMGMEGTWSDALIIQGVAEAYNLKIYIIETHENFNPVTIIEPQQEESRTITIGHLDEFHYVSTASFTDESQRAEYIAVR